MATDDVARDLISRVLDKDNGAHGQANNYPSRGARRQAAPQQQPQQVAYYQTYVAPPQQVQKGLPIYAAPQNGVMPAPLYQQGWTQQAPSRGMTIPTQQMPSRGADTDYVNEAFSDALSRARQKWNFSLAIAMIIAGLIIAGITVTGVWLLMGQTNGLTALFGSGATILGVLSWLLARPASQLNDADNQVSLLMMIWTKYTQDLQGCERITDPTGASTCMSKAGDEAIDHFNSIVGKTTTGQQTS